MKNIITLIVLFFVVNLTFSQVDLGDKVPNFNALDQDGSKWVLKKQLKTADYLVIYLYFPDQLS